MLHRTNTAALPTTEAARLATAKLKENHLRNLEDQFTELAVPLDMAIALVRVRS